MERRTTASRPTMVRGHRSESEDAVTVGGRTTVTAMGGRVGRGILLAAAALVMVSCSNGDATGGATTTAASTSTVESSATVATTSTPSTSVPVESSTTTSTSVTTTTMSTTTTTTVTVPPAVALEAEVAEAYEERYEGYWVCLRAPADCDFAYVFPNSGSDTGLRATIQGLLDRDRYVGPGDVGTYTIQSIDVEGDRAVVEACWWSTAVLYTTPVDPTRPASDENPPTVVSDTPLSAVLIDTLDRDAGGQWLLAGSEIVSEHPEENVCSG